MYPVCHWSKFYYFKVKLDKAIEKLDLKQSCDWIQSTTHGHIMKKVM